MLLFQDVEIHDDDDDIQPLVIDTWTPDTCPADSTDQNASKVGSPGHTDVEQDATHSTELSSTSPSSPVLQAVNFSENCDEEEDRGEYDELSERNHDESVSSDSQSIGGSSSKDLTGSISAGDLSPGPGMTASCSKSRRKADRVRSTSIFFDLLLNTL